LAPGVPAGSLDWCLEQAMRAETGKVILAAATPLPARAARDFQDV
jgi:hypothetical protein